jgi:hypothetical protein
MSPDRSPSRRGARALQAADWPFGAVGRRLLLTEVLTSAPPESGWRKSDLERVAGVTTGGAEAMLSGLVLWELLDLVDGRFHPRTPAPPVAEPLARLLALTAHVKGEIPPLPRRPYARRPGKHP